jgi:hypothetical protein
MKRKCKCCRKPFRPFPWGRGRSHECKGCKTMKLMANLNGGLNPDTFIYRKLYNNR